MKLIEPQIVLPRSWLALTNLGLVRSTNVGNSGWGLSKDNVRNPDCRSRMKTTQYNDKSLSGTAGCHTKIQQYLILRLAPQMFLYLPHVFLAPCPRHEQSLSPQIIEGEHPRRRAPY